MRKRIQAKPTEERKKKAMKSRAYSFSKNNKPMWAPLKASQPFSMKYFEHFDAATSTTIPAVYVFSLNGMYDPNITSTGHQPRGFDQIMAMYTGYCVKNATIRASVCNKSDFPSIIGIHIAGIPTPYTTVRQYIEAANTHYKIQGFAGAETLEVYYSANIASFAGKKDDMDADLIGDTGANPDVQVYAHVFMHSIDYSTTWTGYFNAEITYQGVAIEQTVPPIS